MEKIKEREWINDEIFCDDCGNWHEAGICQEREKEEKQLTMET